ncbi:MAG: F0F1 ATP synthase subunit epsilon [Elusimicrobiota bacterium]
MTERKLTLEMVTPERVALSEQVDAVALPAFAGEMGVLPGHEPYLVQLVAGVVRVRSGGSERRFAVSGGFAEVHNDRVEVFAETAEMSDAIDVERARQALERAKAEAKRRDLDSMTLAQAESSMRRAEVRLRVSQLRRPMKGPKPKP